MRVQVNLSESLVKKIDEYSKEIGSNRSAICAMIISEKFLRSEDKIKHCPYCNNELKIRLFLEK